MKKTLFMLGLMFTALTLSNCTKTEEQDVVPGKPNENAFELFATPTRTTTDGMSTSWAAADEINVFHAVAGTENYVHDTPYDSASGGGTPFTIAAEDLETGRFTGNLAETLDPSQNYDWYLFYPYSSYIETPANVNGFSTIGHRDDGSMTQNGNSDMSHVSGENCPLYGIATNVPGSQTPDVVMHHLTSVLEVVVTNNATEEITVSRITFKTANEKIVGRFYIDFSSDNIVYNPHDTYAVNQASLNVTNGAPIAVGESAKFYLAIKPFTTSNDTLTLTVTTDKGVCEKSIDLTSETSFVAGNIKVLNIGFTAQDTPEPTPASSWKLVTSLDEIVAGEYIIVAKLNDAVGFLPTTEATSKSSLPIYDRNITIDEATNTVANVSETMKWTFSGSTSNMTITSPEGNTLYLIDDNSGTRISNSSDKNNFSGWTIAAHNVNGTVTPNAFSFSGTIISKSSTRFLGMYHNSNTGKEDWRCYTTINAGNFTGSNGSSKIYLYKNSEGALPALAAPTGLSVSNDVVTWNAVENAGTYTVTVGSVSETVSETSYTYTGEAGIFDVSVVANPADASSYVSSPVATLTGIKFGKPVIDSPVVSVSGITAEGFTASWPAVANASGYLADVTTDAEGLNSVGSVAETPGDPYTITVTGLAESTEYYLHVYAIANEGYTDAPVVTTTVTTRSSEVQASVIDVLTIETLGVTATSYAEGNFSGVSILSNAIYAGNCIKSSPNGAIQLRSKESNCGIITTTSGGRATKVVVTWNVAAGNDQTATGRTLNIYGSTTPYTSAADLYDTSTQGTLIGTIVCGTSTELVITGDYPYIGLRSDDGAMYLTQIEITWEK